jgi:hypothetical protein
MSKQNAANLTPENAQDSLNELLNLGESKSGITYAEGFEILEKADSAKMTELTSEYFNFEKPGTYNFVFEGMSTANIDGKTVDVVLLRDKEGKQLINGNAVLVNSLRKVTILPTFVRVQYIGDEKSAKGSYKNLSVRVLPNAVK